jgi:RimJ/RimL family protein N-acetyltransferase
MSDSHVPGPAYRIHTRRLVLRCWDPADAPLLKAAIDASLDHLRPWMPWAADEPQPLQTKVGLLRRFRGEFDLGRDFVYGIFCRGEGEVLVVDSMTLRGGAGLHTRLGEGALEIGYWIHAAHINQGLATETAAALTKVAFQVHGVDRVEIHCDPANLRSAAVPRKLGYLHEATLRRRARTADGKPRDTMVWTLFAQAYAASAAAAAEVEAFDAMGRSIRLDGSLEAPRDA